MPLLAQRFAVAVICLTALLLVPPRAMGRDLVIGSISTSVKEEIQDFQPFADYLAAHLAGHGITAGRVLVASGVDEMVDRLSAGEVDLYIDSPLTAAQIGRQSGAEPMLRRWKKGVAEYHSVFVTLAGSGIDGLDDLKNRVVAFDDPFSSSGYLVPKAMLLKRGYQVVEVKAADSTPPEGAIGYVFSNDDMNTMFWLLKRRVDAGVTSPSFLKEFTSKLGEGKFSVFARSMSMPRHVVMRRGDLDPTLTAAITEVLLGMEHDAEGRRVLKDFQETTRFDRFPGGVAATFGPIHAVLDVLGRDTGF